MAKSSTRLPAEVRPRESALPTAAPDAPPSLGNAAKVVAWGLVFWGIVELAGAAFEKTAMATLLVQAVIAGWGAGRMGIVWTDPGKHAPARSPFRRAATGAVVGAVAASAAVVLSLSFHSATLWPTTIAPGALFIGLAASGLAAVRDELLLRGVVLRTTRGLWPPWAMILASGATSAAATFGGPGASVSLLLAEGLRGAALGGAWLRDRGAWMPCAANAAWMWGFGAATRGAMWDVRFDSAPDPARPTLAVLSLAAAAAMWALLPGNRRKTGRSPGVAETTGRRPVA